MHIPNFVFSGLKFTRLFRQNSGHASICTDAESEST